MKKINLRNELYITICNIKNNFISKSKNFKKIPISQILIGQQSGFPLEKWVELSGETERISVPLIDSCYVNFLRDIIKNEKLLKDDDYLGNSDYFKMVMTCINTVGHFMGAKNEEEAKEWMRKFFYMFELAKKGVQKEISLNKGQSKQNSPILLYKLKHSDCYEVVDGHHRIALAYMCGEKEIKAKIIGRRYSILQKKLLRINQVHDVELYQPVDRLEVKNWPVVRNCEDRLLMMNNFLKKYKIKKSSVIDLACSYGWFLYKFKNNGFNVFGVDRDEKAIEIARLIYKLNEKELEIVRIEDFFKKNDKKYDIVLFLSILHHYAIGKEKGRIEEILRSLDNMTNKILFIDTGQNHEKWFKENLKEWNDDYIINLIKSNTSFKEVISLGKDNDNRGKYKDNYRRTLFACVK